MRMKSVNGQARSSRKGRSVETEASGAVFEVERLSGHGEHLKCNLGQQTNHDCIHLHLATRRSHIPNARFLVAFTATRRILFDSASSRILDCTSRNALLIHPSIHYIFSCAAATAAIHIPSHNPAQSPSCRTTCLPRSRPLHSCLSSNSNSNSTHILMLLSNHTSRISPCNLLHVLTRHTRTLRLPLESPSLLLRDHAFRLTPNHRTRPTARILRRLLFPKVHTPTTHP